MSVKGMLLPVMNIKFCVKKEPAVSLSLSFFLNEFIAYFCIDYITLDYIQTKLQPKR